MRYIILLVAVLVFALAACGRDYETEARIQADAQVQSARLAADASIQTTQIEQVEATKRNTAVVAVLPMLLLIIGVGGVVWLVVWFRGRRELIIVEAMVQIPEFVQAEAHRRGLLVEPRADGYYLVDAARVPRARLTARE